MIVPPINAASIVSGSVFYNTFRPSGTFDVIAMKVDMSAAAVTARLKLACGLGDAERLATAVRRLMAEIKPESSASTEPRKKKKAKHARIHS